MGLSRMGGSSTPSASIIPNLKQIRAPLNPNCPAYNPSRAATPHLSAGYSMCFRPHPSPVPAGFSAGHECASGWLLWNVWIFISGYESRRLCPGDRYYPPVMKAGSLSNVVMGFSARYVPVPLSHFALFTLYVMLLWHNNKTKSC